MDSPPDATVYAHRLLSGLRAETGCVPQTPSGLHPAVNNQKCGLHAPSDPSGSTWIVPVALADMAEGALTALKVLAKNHHLPPNGAVLLGERCRLFGTSPGGTVSAGGSCRFFRARDGFFALNLAREEDFDLLPALTGAAGPEKPGEASEWAEIFPNLPVDQLVSTGRELGLAIAPVCLPGYGSQTSPASGASGWAAISRPASSVNMKGEQPDRPKKPLVADLSSLWAGPLAGSLLAMLGAEVVKVESNRRPDGARRGETQGEQDFFNLLNGEKKSFACDFTTRRGRARLHRLLRQADIVIEASRPRALRQLGLSAEKLVAEKPGKVWLSLTAYGRGAATEDNIGFGDDIGVAAGLSGLMEAVYGQPLFVGDAIADPLGGLHGALAAWFCWQQGGGMIDLSLHGVLEFALRQDPLLGLFNGEEPKQTVNARLKQRAGNWARAVEQNRDAPIPLRRVKSPAPAMGRDTEAIMGRQDAH